MIQARTSFIKISRPAIFSVIGVLAAVAGASSLSAQGLPPRPGLPAPAATPSPQPSQLPSVPLNQRDYFGQFPAQQQAGVPGQPGIPGQPGVPGGFQGAAPTQQPVISGSGQEEFFYIDENSKAPERFANQLSIRNESIIGQAGSQLGGDYGNIHRVLDPRGTVQSAWNRPFDNMADGQTAPGVVRFQWSSDLVMPVRIREGFVTNLILPDWDAVEDVMIGDQSVLEATIIRPNVVGIRPLHIGSDATINVLSGAGNVYSFYIRSEGRNTRAITDINVFVQAEPSKGRGQWFNDERRNNLSGGLRASIAPDLSSDIPQGSQSRPQESSTVVLDRSISNGDEPVPVDRRFFNLRMFEVNSGDRIIAPEYAYTDGRWTYLHFPSGVTDRPVVFRVSDGVEGRVNTRVSGDHGEVVIVEALGDFVLRSGQKIVCIKEIDTQ